MFTQWTLFATILLTVLFGKHSECECSADDIESQGIYSVPEPKIEVFARGFRVAIPDQEGVKLFAFHGNINKPMNDLEAGQFTRDVLKPEGGYWVFEDKVTRLNVGDVIYYWLFVIRYNLGFRFDNGRFVVSEIVSRRPVDSASFLPDGESSWIFDPADKPIPFHTPNPMGTATVEHKPVSTCCQLFLNVSSQLTLVSDEIDRLRAENKILTEIAQKDEYYAKTLKIYGKYSSEYYPTPKDFVRNIINEKLHLSNIKIEDAKKIPDNGVSFKVETLKEKMKIIMVAKAKLLGSNYELSW